MPNPRSLPVIHAQFNVFVDGGQKLLGLAEVTLPAFEAMKETLSGAGIMGELDVPVTGQFSAFTFSMSFKMLWGDPLDFVMSKPYHFDLRSAIELEDPSDYSRQVSKERWSITGPISKIDPGKRAPQSTADATIEVAGRRVEHFIDGRQVMLLDPLNDQYMIMSTDVYKPIRDAIN